MQIISSLVTVAPLPVINMCDLYLFFRSTSYSGFVLHVGPANHTPRIGTSSANGIGNQLLVKVDGQFTIFDISSQPSKTTAEVRFADGSRQNVELARLRLISWTED